MKKLKKHSLYNSALVYLNKNGNVVKAKELFSEFKNKYPNDRLNDDAEIVFNINSSGLDRSSTKYQLILPLYLIISRGAGSMIKKGE